MRRGYFQSLGVGGGHAGLGLRNAQPLHHLAEAVAVLGQIDGLRRRAEDLHPGRSSSAAMLSGVCPPNCTMAPSGFSFS